MLADMFELDKPLKDIQRVLPIEVLPKTYADATNVSCVYLIVAYLS